MRHEVLDRFLIQSKSVDYLMEHLKDANFDPEFYKKHEEEIVAKFNNEQGTDIRTKKRSWKRILTGINS